jgi:hypothetical protein
MKRLALSCVAAALLAATAASAAPAARLASYCSPSGDVCYGAFNRGGRLILQITTAARYFTRYTLCVTKLPRGAGAANAQRCGAFPLFRGSGSTWSSSVNYARQYIGLPGAKPARGRYRVTWRQVCSTCSAREQRHSALGQPLGPSLYVRWRA